MKLLIADIRKEQHLRETIGLLEFIGEHRAEIPDLVIQVQKDVKDHALVLPNSCIKGVDDIWEFIRKYVEPAAPQETVKPRKTATTAVSRDVDESDDLNSYRKQLLASGDEDKEVSLTQQIQQQQRGVISKPSRPASTPVIVQEESELDLQSEMTRRLRQGGD